MEDLIETFSTFTFLDLIRNIVRRYVFITHMSVVKQYCERYVSQPTNFVSFSYSGDVLTFTMLLEYCIVVDWFVAYAYNCICVSFSLILVFIWGACTITRFFFKFSYIMLQDDVVFIHAISIPLHDKSVSFSSTHRDLTPLQAMIVFRSSRQLVIPGVGWIVWKGFFLLNILPRYFSMWWRLLYPKILLAPFVTIVTPHKRK